jgi:hypothetical protein
MPPRIDLQLLQSINRPYGDLPGFDLFFSDTRAEQPPRTVDLVRGDPRTLQALASQQSRVQGYEISVYDLLVWNGYQVTPEQAEGYSNANAFAVLSGQNGAKFLTVTVSDPSAPSAFLAPSPQDGPLAYTEQQSANVPVKTSLPRREAVPQPLPNTDQNSGAYDQLDPVVQSWYRGQMELQGARDILDKNGGQYAPANTDALRAAHARVNAAESTAVLEAYSDAKRSFGYAGALYFILTDIRYPASTLNLLAGLAAPNVIGGAGHGELVIESVRTTANPDYRMVTLKNLTTGDISSGLSPVSGTWANGIVRLSPQQTADVLSGRINAAELMPQTATLYGAGVNGARFRITNVDEGNFNQKPGWQVRRDDGAVIGTVYAWTAAEAKVEAETLVLFTDAPISPRVYFEPDYVARNRIPVSYTGTPDPVDGQSSTPTLYILMVLVQTPGQLAGQWHEFVASSPQAMADLINATLPAGQDVVRIVQKNKDNTLGNPQSAFIINRNVLSNNMPKIIEWCGLNTGPGVFPDMMPPMRTKPVRVYEPSAFPEQDPSADGAPPRSSLTIRAQHLGLISRKINSDKIAYDPDNARYVIAGNGYNKRLVARSLGLAPEALTSGVLTKEQTKALNWDDSFFVVKGTGQITVFYVQEASLNPIINATTALVRNDRTQIIENLLRTNPRTSVRAVKYDPRSDQYVIEARDGQNVGLHIIGAARGKLNPSTNYFCHPKLLTTEERVQIGADNFQAVYTIPATELEPYFKQ